MDEDLRLFDVSDLQRKNRELLVVKDSRIIQDLKYAKDLSLSLEQFKIITYALGRIKQDYQGYKERGYIALTYREFCETAGINLTNGRAVYRKLKSSMIALMRKGKFIKLPGVGEPWVRWLDRVVLSPEDLPPGYFKLTFDSMLLPYLIDIKGGHFTQYEEGFVMCFKTMYAPRLYEELRSRLHRGIQGSWTAEYTIERLRGIFMVEDNESYKKNTTMFKERVIDRSIQEINEYSDLYILYEYKLSGRRITSVIFELRNKSEDELYMTKERNNRELDRSAGLLKQ